MGIRVGWVADLQRLHPLDELVDEGVVDVGVHDEPLGGDTGLPVVLHPTGDRGFDGLVEVHGRHHDERVAAAEFDHGRFAPVATDGGHRLTGRFAAGQGGRRDPRITQDALDGVEETSSVWKQPSGKPPRVMTSDR